MDSTLAPSFDLREPRRPFRILLVDDDDMFCQVMERVAHRAGVFLTYCGSFEELERLPSHRAFDVVILDYYLGDLTGAHVASVLGDRPVLLISSVAVESTDALPKAVRDFALKSSGPENILASAMMIANTDERPASSESDALLPPNHRREKIFSQVRELIGSADEATLREVVDLFLAQAAATLLKLQVAVNKREADDVERLAGELRASSNNVGATALARWCAQIERRVRAENWDRLVLFASGLSQEFGKTRDLLESR